MPPNMPDSLVGISIPRSSRRSTVPCPLSHRSQVPHPRVRGRSLALSLISSPVWSARTGPQRAPPSRHRCSLDGCQNSLGFQVPALSSTSRSSLLHTQHHSATYGLVRGSPRGTRAAPESQQGGEDPYLGNHPFFPRARPSEALSREGTWGKVDEGDTDAQGHKAVHRPGEG